MRPTAYVCLVFAFAAVGACALKQTRGAGGGPPAVPPSSLPAPTPAPSANPTPTLPPEPVPSPEAKPVPEPPPAGDDDGGTTELPPNGPIDTTGWQWTIPSSDCANCLLNKCVEQADDFMGPHFHETYDQYGQEPTRYFDGSCVNYMNCLAATDCADTFGTGVSTQSRTNCETDCLHHPGVEPSFEEQDFAHPEACRGARDRFDDCVETSCDEICRKKPPPPLPPPPPPPPAGDPDRCIARLRGSPLPVTVPLASVVVTEATTGAFGNWAGPAQLGSPKLPEAAKITCGVPSTHWRYAAFDLQDAPFPVLNSTLGPWTGPFPNPGDGVKLRVAPTLDVPVAATAGLEDLCRKRVHAVNVPKENLIATMPPGVFWNTVPTPLPAFPAGTLPQDLLYSIPDARLSLSCKTKWEITVDYTMVYDFRDPAGANDCGGLLTIVGTVVTKLSESEFQLSGTLTTTTVSSISGNLSVDIPPPEIVRDANGVITDGVLEDQYLEYGFAWNPSDFLKAMKVTSICPSNGFHGSYELMHPAMPVINFWGTADKAPGASPPVARIRLPTKDKTDPIPTQTLFPHVISLDITRRLREVQ